jgi:hypothetical protein
MIRVQINLEQAVTELRPGQAGIVAVVEQASAARAEETLAARGHLARLVLGAEAAAVLTGDPAVGPAAGGAVAKTGAGPAAVGFEADPAGSTGRPTESDDAGAASGGPPSATAGDPSA